MNNFVGKKWRMLTEKEKELLLKNCWCIDGVTGNVVKGGDCIVDLTDTLSIVGKVVDDEIIIEDEATIYSSCS
ncbi:hypothetical protein [uncultured Clostridium sp.]|jgi:hypothetical protein|uniref:hypothetical protein n=1 Tax=uncultured Clostridium sp. TaxID=59620 RepID=UPI002634F339|nr:hypothetical protein [uncultured Clostridium sp.]